MTTQNTPQTNASSPPLSLFDLETYISRYDHHSETRLQRLLFLAERAPLREDRVTAYGLAERHMKEMGNIKKYREVFSDTDTAPGIVASSAGIVSGEVSSEIRPELTPAATVHDAQTTPSVYNPSAYGFTYDYEYVTLTEQTSQVKLQTLEGCLSTAQAHLAKDSIRTAYLALGEFHRSRGELREALRRVLRSRDYCTNTRQSGQVCLMVVELAIDSKNYAQVRDYVAKAEHTSDLMHGTHDPLFSSKLAIASGLVFLAEKNYASAALKFVSVHAEMTKHFNSVASSEDICLYGALLALATMERVALSSKILESPNFKGRLELVPPLRDAVRHYVRAEYGSCLSLLESLRGSMMLDIHLYPHVEELLLMIRDKCIVQYFAPYTAISLRTMGQCFGFQKVEDMEDIVADLILKGKIVGARINSLDKTLSEESVKSIEKQRRRMTRRRVVKLGNTFLRETESMILRLSCLENNVLVQNDAKSKRFTSGNSGGAGDYMGRSRNRNWGNFSIDDSSDEDVEEAAMMDMDV